ncbi:ornithine carbamoyltransferase [Campylobacter sp. MIT 97-5078]|uniref:ornithine carbamoyltransferase n=2 Tax=Campylobacter sp. MIT 97-5078 TaxID=1548153 RepID=UPI001160B221|nr:ornithine carbamoyltransferase [Campylobacter sp. MIT 97-5078]TQR26759.1 ornithine carbamoyltransferase [Campylobacter sp. MIT 97-5078]
MKITLECKDIILENALRLFLREYLVMKKDCDFLVCDEKSNELKPQFIIAKSSSQLSVPFSKEQLLKALFEFHTALCELAEKKALEKKKALEEKIERIASEFRKSYQNEIDMAIDALKTKLLNALDE